MSTYVLLKSALLLHIAGIVMMAGVTLADYIIGRQFWKHLPADRPRAIAINALTAKFPAFIGIGALILIVSGITMVGVYKGGLDGQAWFRIKMAMVVLLILNSLLMNRPASAKIRKLMAGNGGPDDPLKLRTLKTRLNVFYAIQLVLLLTVFLMSTFRFQ